MRRTQARGIRIVSARAATSSAAVAATASVQGSSTSAAGETGGHASQRCIALPSAAAYVTGTSARAGSSRASDAVEVGPPDRGASLGDPEPIGGEDERMERVPELVARRDGRAVQPKLLRLALREPRLGA